jgi:hypothetical protein
MSTSSDRLDRLGSIDTGTRLSMETALIMNNGAPVVIPQLPPADSLILTAAYPMTFLDDLDRRPRRDAIFGPDLTAEIAHTR